MESAPLQDIAQTVVRRAQSQGFVHPGDIREELVRAELPPDRWHEVVELAGGALRACAGRYEFVSPMVLRLRPRVRQQQDRLQGVQRVVQELLESCQAEVAQDQRRQERYFFIQPVTIATADGRQLQFLTQNISARGIQLLGNCSLLGQEIQLRFTTANSRQWQFAARILWANVVGDGLVRQGGLFLGQSSDESPSADNR